MGCKFNFICLTYRYFYYDAYHLLRIILHVNWYTIKNISQNTRNYYL